jgi:hypothetical protein
MIPSRACEIVVRREGAWVECGAKPATPQKWREGGTVNVCAMCHVLLLSKPCTARLQ